jgi:hypothetical protein
MSTPAERRPLADRPLAAGEVVAGGIAVMLGLVVAAGMEVYDLRSIPLRMGFTVTGVVLSVVSTWLALALARVPAPTRGAGALWATLPTALLLSQLPYFGFLLVPVEVIASALLLSFRTRAGMGVASLIAIVVRLGVLGCITMLRGLL